MSQKSQTSAGGRIVLTILSLMFIGTGVAMVAQAVQGLASATDSKGWPTTTGRITRSELVVSDRDSRPGETGDRSSQRKSRSYSASIEYEFSVGGIVYRGSRVAAVKEMIGNLSFAQSILDKYPIAKEVVVAYLPENPEDCLLEPGSAGGAPVLIVLGCCFAVLPLFLLRVVWRSK